MPLDPADAGRLRDMIDYGQEAMNLLGSLTAEQMVADRRTFLAVSRCVEVVGEAGWKLSHGFKQGQPAIPWLLIAGMRHRLVHDYGRVDPVIVHNVIAIYLPPLVVQLKSILGE